MAISNILVVDDSPTDRQYLSEILSKSGFKVATAESAEDAMAKLRTSRPDLVLTTDLIRDVFGVEVAMRDHPTMATRVPLPVARVKQAPPEIEPEAHPSPNPERKPSPHA